MKRPGNLKIARLPTPYPQPPKCMLATKWGEAWERLMKREMEGLSANSALSTTPVPPS